jgi:hypothetical protein
VVNGPDGPVSYTLGNGLNVYRTYDILGRFVGQWVCSGPAAPACSGGAQIYGTSSGWKGSQLLNQADTVLNQQVSYSYGDGFNRLTVRTVTSGTVQNYTYSYDRYGKNPGTDRTIPLLCSTDMGGHFGPKITCEISHRPYTTPVRGWSTHYR